MEGIENLAFEDDPPVDVVPSPHHYSTLQHPSKKSAINSDQQHHQHDRCKQCNSAPSTLLRNHKSNGHDGYINGLYINITADGDGDSGGGGTINNNNNTVLPSPTLRAHELAVLATPFKIVSSSSSKKRSDSTVNLHAAAAGRHGGRDGPHYLQRVALNRRLLMLSITLGILLGILTIVIIVVWQLVFNNDSSLERTTTTTSSSSSTTTSMMF